MTALARVFDVPELAESILTQLTMRDILCGVVQTSQHWRAVVESSLHLQRALFRAPVALPPLLYIDAEDEGAMSCEDEETRNATTERWTTSPSDPEAYTVIAHPLITDLLRGLWSLSGNRIRALLRPEASWRHCVITQPPIQHLVYNDHNRSGRPRRVNACGAGVTFGEIVTEKAALLAFRSGWIRGANQFRWAHRTVRLQRLKVRHGSLVLTMDDYRGGQRDPEPEYHKLPAKTLSRGV
jgi:hypothetical protein